MPGSDTGSVSLKQREREWRKEARGCTEVRPSRTEDEEGNLQVQLPSCPLWCVEHHGKPVTWMGKGTGFKGGEMLGCCVMHPSPGRRKKIPE